MRAPDVEQAHVVVQAPLDEQAQVRRVADQRVAGVAGEEPCDRSALGDAARLVAANDLDGDSIGCGHNGLPW
jgi:hypothetical protein